uniref:Uncharacterized protein n=1 Tax=Anopheles minimus TaxID=112268 RepID=A0A182W4C1_9DIPT
MERTDRDLTSVEIGQLVREQLYPLVQTTQPLAEAMHQMWHVPLTTVGRVGIVKHVGECFRSGGIDSGQYDQIVSGKVIPGRIE